MDDLLQEFLAETAEALDLADTELVRFEAKPDDTATLNNIFRLVHTVKGTCGFLGLQRLEAVAHAGETLLGKFRDGALAVTPASVTLVLKAIDRIKVILVGLEATGVEPVGDDRALIEALQAAAEGQAGAALEETAPAPAAAEKRGPNGEAWDEDLQRFLRPGEVSLADLERAFLDAQPEAATIEAPAPAAASDPLHEDEDDAARASRAEPGSGQTIRVNVDMLEQLMTLVSELVLTRNQLLQLQRHKDEASFKAPLQRLSQITGELQDRVMKTRMQPVGAAWRKLPRIVRDICRETGKRIELRLEGEATELDRQVLELIRDPLTHMVRNSADHGIETPAARARAGKSETGVIRLNARHEGGHILMEIADDGAGLSTARIRQKAIDRGLTTAAEAATLTDQQIHRFIFVPGFSTAEKVTSISGRGVGMDVVRTNIDAIGGSIEVQSVEGRGSSFRVKIPLTLAIVAALIVGSAGQRFALPQSSVVELVGVGEGVEHRIERINHTPVLRLREKLLPLVSLNEVLGLPSASGAGGQSYVVVLQGGDQRFGLIVDAVFDTEEIVVKPLASLLRGERTLSGATILGDGSVVTILDPNGLGEHARLETSEAEREAAAIVAKSSEDGRDGLVLFRAGGETIKAAPLMLVTRLEEAPAAKIERADGRAVLQYRGALMPIVHAGGDYAFKTEGAQPILVFADGPRAFGLAVDEIVDIVHEPAPVELTLDQPGILGVAVVRGKTTEIVDIGHYLDRARQGLNDARVAARASKGRVLLVEPSEFVRTMLRPLLSIAGYEPVEATNAEEALAQLEAGGRFGAILADVDADPAAAAQLIAELSADPRAAGAAIVALSDKPEKQGAFGACAPKTNRWELLSTLAHASEASRSAEGEIAA